MCLTLASLNKIILLEKKKISDTVESGIPIYPYLYLHQELDLIDTPDPKEEIPTIQILSLSPLRVRTR